MTIIVDPYLISIPYGDKIDQEDVLEYVQYSETWNQEFINHSNKYVVSSFVMVELYTQGLMPTIDNLQLLYSKYKDKLFEDNNEVVIQPHDIALACDKVINNLPLLEERLGDEDIECIEGKEVIEPKELIERLYPKVAKKFTNSLVCFGYALAKQKQHTVWSIASTPIPNKQVDAKLLVEGKVETISESAVTVSREWPILFHPDDRYASMNVADLVYQEKVDLATKVAWCKMKQEGISLKGIDPNQFRFGRKFIKSLICKEMTSRQNFEKELEQTFRAIVHVLGNIWSYGSDKHHALRQSIQNRQTRQQVRKHRDGSGARQTDKAARVEVTAGKTPLRLHYWQCFDGTYEFSNVTTDHDDPTIYY